MTTLAINDLALSKELDRQAMRSHLGGRGLGRSALFSFFLPASSASVPGGTGSFTFNQTVNTNVTNTLNQIFVDTLQFNQLNQIVDISNSPGARVDQLGKQQNGNLELSGFPVAA